jgi:hypothetical protein
MKPGSEVKRNGFARITWLLGLVGIVVLSGWFFSLNSANNLTPHDPLSAVRDRMFMVANVKILSPAYQPAAGAIVTLDDSQQVIADANGIASFEHLMHDNHLLSVYYNGQHYRLPLHTHSAESGVVLGISDELRLFGTSALLLGLLVWLGLGLQVFKLNAKLKSFKPVSLNPVGQKGLQPRFVALVASFLLAALFVPVFAGGEGLALAAPQYNASLPVPADVKVEEDDNNAILSWDGGGTTDPNPEGVGGYRVSWGVAGQPLGNVALTQYRILQLQPLVNGQKYEAQVQAVDMLGNLSTPSQTVSFAGTSARVDQMRSRMTGFFDDFNRPAGAASELKWNNAWSFCSDPAFSSMFINNQFHVHNMVAATNCDRGQSISRPRNTFDFTGRTGTISFDFDGEFRRDQWYLDLVPDLMDITGQVNIEAGDVASNPGNVLRFHQNEQIVEILWIDAKGVETKLASTDYNPYPPLDELGLKLVSNVRRHWELKVSQNSAEVWINGKKVVATNKLNLPFGKATVLWNEFSYNTRKSNEPYVLVHWDNFGFDGPASQIETHNYRTPGYGGFDYVELQKESVIREIKIPDEVKGATAQRLMFTMQMSNNWYDWSPEDKVIINGQTFPVPKPSGIQTELINLVSEINPYSMIINLPPGVLKTGDNQIEFVLLSCGVTNVHAELDFPAGKAPAYTPPEKVYPLVTMPAMPDVGPGAFIQAFGDTKVEIGGTVEEEEAKKVFPVSGRVPVKFVVHNDIALAATGRNPGITKVELRLNQKPIYSVDLNDAPYFEGAYVLDTSQYANGQYAIDVVATNKNGVTSIPDYFQGDSVAGDYYPLQIGINNPKSGSTSLPVAPAGKAHGDQPASTPGPNIPKPKPAPVFGNSGDNNGSVDATNAEPVSSTAAANNSVASAPANLSKTTPADSKIDLKAMLPLLIGGLLGCLSLYLVTGALVGDSLRRKHRVGALKAGMILGWPYFALRRPKQPSPDLLNKN